MIKSKKNATLTNTCLMKTYVIASIIIVITYVIIDSQITRRVVLETSRYETSVNIQFYKSRDEPFWHALGDLFRTDIPDHLVEKSYSSLESAEKDVRMDTDGVEDVDSEMNTFGEIHPAHSNLLYDDANSFVVVENTNVEEARDKKDDEISNAEKELPEWRKKPMFQNIYKQPVIRRIKDKYVFYLSAIAGNSTIFSQWDQIVVNGWEAASAINHSHACCLKLANGTVRGVRLTSKMHWEVCAVNVLAATRWVCPNPFEEGVLPTEFGFANKFQCSSVQYIPIEYAMEQPKGSIAVCAKVAYGEFPAGRMLEWFEVNKLMGVDKVVMFTYNLTEAAERVLKHYEDNGFLVRKYFDYPMKLSYPRYIGQKYMLAWHDEQVTVYDCMERLNGYSYVAVLDLDEFLIPNKKYFKNWDSMLSVLQHRNKKASGFSFHTEIFTLDWGVSNRKGSYFVTKYINRTRPMWDRKKNIMIPQRVVPGSVWTHNYDSVRDYKLTNISSEVANIKHYRRCRPHWIEFGNCHKNRRRYTDTTMLQVVGKLEKNLTQLKNQLQVPNYL